MTTYSMQMKIDILTIFPEMFPPVLDSSILKRAQAKKVVKMRVHDLRSWSKERHRKVDDRPYGGGPGMVMKPEPFFDAVDQLKKEARRPSSGPKRRTKKSAFRTVRPHVILLSPRGKKLTQPAAERLAKKRWLILLCGHYEGVDERVREGLVDEELSIGDYVLTCGELPAMVLVDAVVRLLPGSLGDDQSTAQESFCENLLESPHYTRPAVYRGRRVPKVLLTGDVPRVQQWRKLQALRRTVTQRPDLIHGPENSSD